MSHDEGLPPSIRKKLEYHLEKIAENFRSPMITLIVRNPLMPHGEGDVVLTVDTIDSAIQALENRKSAIMFHEMRHVTNKNPT